MFREIRRKEKQLTIEECNQVLTKAEYGTLATMGADGYPYVVPVNYVFHNGAIYFHCATVGHKLDNIAHCTNVSFNVVTDVMVIPQIVDTKGDNIKVLFNGFKTNFNSVTIFGKAREVFAGEKMEGLIALFKNFLHPDDLHKYEKAGIEYITRSLEQTKLIKIEIENISGKRGVRENREIQGKQH